MGFDNRIGGCGAIVIIVAILLLFLFQHEGAQRSLTTSAHASALMSQTRYYYVRSERLLTRIAKHETTSTCQRRPGERECERDLVKFVLRLQFFGHHMIIELPYSYSGEMRMKRMNAISSPIRCQVRTSRGTKYRCG